MIGSVRSVRAVAAWGGAGRNLVVVLGMHYWDQVISCREEEHRRGRALTFECVHLTPSQDDVYYLNGECGYKRSALHMASENGLLGTVAKLLSHGANAGLADEVRTCICVQT